MTVSTFRDSADVLRVLYHQQSRLSSHKAWIFHVCGTPHFLTVVVKFMIWMRHAEISEKGTES